MLRQHALFIDSYGKKGKKFVLKNGNSSLVCMDDAFLPGAEFRCADMSYSEFMRSNLSGAVMLYANAFACNFAGADLRMANCWHTNFENADFRGADLRGTSFIGANLYNADFTDAKLDGVNFCQTIASPQCPETGSFIAWKSCGRYVVKLLIPDDAKRCSGTSRACRASKAKVLAIENIDGTDSGLTKIASDFDSDFVYYLGRTAKVRVCAAGSKPKYGDFCECRWNTVSPGIHFFLSRSEAVSSMTL